MRLFGSHAAKYLGRPTAKLNELLDKQPKECNAVMKGVLIQVIQQRKRSPKKILITKISWQ